MKLILSLSFLLLSTSAFATPAECKLTFYNFNKAHDSRVEAVGVVFGKTVTLGFRHDVAPNLQEQSDMANLIRACVSTGMMEPGLYRFKKSAKEPHSSCRGFNPETLGMVCEPYKPVCKAKCPPPQLVKGDAEGNPIALK